MNVKLYALAFSFSLAFWFVSLDSWDCLLRHNFDNLYDVFYLISPFLSQLVFISSSV